MAPTRLYKMKLPSSAATVDIWLYSIPHRSPCPWVPAASHSLTLPDSSLSQKDTKLHSPREHLWHANKEPDRNGPPFEFLW